MWKLSLGYYVDGEFVDAGEVQHRRANVDFNVKRGLPLYTPVRKNLRRAEKLLRNMSIVAEIQSAIALIRKHRGASRSGIEQFVASDADATATNSLSGRTRHYSQYGPGTILDAPAGLEYDFPARGLDASTFVTVLQAELRAIAARLVMPEFMFTSDASNANFASTMVAEGPAIRMFERLQASTIEQDRAVMWRVVENAVAQAGCRATSAALWKSRSCRRRCTCATSSPNAGRPHRLRQRHPLAANMEPAFGAGLRSGAEEPGGARGSQLSREWERGRRGEGETQMETYCRSRIVTPTLPLSLSPTLQLGGQN